MLQAAMLLLASILSGLLRLVRGSPDWFKDRMIIGLDVFKDRKLVVAQLVLFAMVGLVLVGALSFGISLLAVLLAISLIGIVAISVGTGLAHHKGIRLPVSAGHVLSAVSYVSREGHLVQGGANRSDSLVRFLPVLAMASATATAIALVAATGSISIAPQNTLVAGLGITFNASLFVIASVVVLVLSSAATFRFARA